MWGVQATSLLPSATESHKRITWRMSLCQLTAKQISSHMLSCNHYVMRWCISLMSWLQSVKEIKEWKHQHSGILELIWNKTTSTHGYIVVGRVLITSLARMNPSSVSPVAVAAREVDESYQLPFCLWVPLPRGWSSGGVHGALMQRIESLQT